MMDDFMRQQKSSEMLFHDEPMFKDVAGLSGRWVGGAFYEGVAVSIDKATAFPAPIQFHGSASFLDMFSGMNASRVVMCHTNTIS